MIQFHRSSTCFVLRCRKDCGEIFGFFFVLFEGKYTHLLENVDKARGGWPGVVLFPQKYGGSLNHDRSWIKTCTTYQDIGLCFFCQFYFYFIFCCQFGQCWVIYERGEIFSLALSKLSQALTDSHRLSQALTRSHRLSQSSHRLSQTLTSSHRLSQGLTGSHSSH